MTVLVVIGGLPFETVIFRVPLEEMSRYTHVYLVGEEYSFNASRPVTAPANVAFIPDAPARVFAHRRRFDPSPGVNAFNTASPFSKIVEWIRDDETAMVTYVSTNRVLTPDVVALASLVKTETFRFRYWSIRNSASEAITTTTLPGIFSDVYSIGALRPYYSAADKAALKELITLGLLHLRMFIIGGYLHGENSAQVDSWTLQIGSPWLSLLVSAFKILPTQVDSTIDRDLYESAGVRKAVARATLYTLSYYFTLGADPEVRIRAGDAGDAPDPWTSGELWRVVYDRYTQNINAV